MFWRRGGSQFDYGDNSIIAWIVRIVVFVVVAAFIILMFRLWTTDATAAIHQSVIDVVSAAKE